jgi:hypothetical protein
MKSDSACYLGIVADKSRADGCRRSGGVADGAVEIAADYDPTNAVSIRMKAIIAELTLHKQEDQQEAGNTYRQPGQVDCGIKPVPHQIPERNLQVTPKHG